MKKYDIDNTSVLRPVDEQLTVTFDEIGANVRKFDSCAGSNGKWYEEAFIAKCYLPIGCSNEWVFDYVVNMTREQKEESLSLRHKLEYPVMYIPVHMRKKLKI